MARSDRRAQDVRSGFTLVELLISLTVGLILVAASLSFAISTFQGAEGNKLREEVYRNGRFIGMSLQRDLQMAGVGIDSRLDFGSLSMFDDTLVVLNVPYDGGFAPAYTLEPPFGATSPLPPGGTCGSHCLDLNKDVDGNYDLAPGDLARLQVNAERRLILIDGVRDMGTTFQVTFLPDTVLLHYEAAFQGGLQLDVSGTSVQKLYATVYYVEDGTLYRSSSFNTAGALEPSPMAYGVLTWNTELLFVDGDTLEAADPADADVTNDYDDLLGARVSATLATNRADLRVADGGVFTRDFEWAIMPRNLMYERNR